ncbi:MAG: hypothetical protein WC408_05540, partial [Candidatus Micrarchaeia archaeon]
MALENGAVMFEADFSGKQYAYTAKVASKQELGAMLSNARRALAENIFDYAPIDRKAIDAYFAKSAKKPKNPAELGQLLSSMSVSSIESALMPTVKFEKVPAEDIKKADIEKRKIGYATSYYIYLLFKSAFSQEAPKASGKAPAGIRLVSNSPEWMVVKKANPAISTKPEVLSALIGMLSTIVRKEGDVLCKEDNFEEASGALFGSFFKRKSFGKLCEAISVVPVPKVTEVADANAFDKGAAADELFILLYLKAFSLSGYSPYPEPDLLAETYPQL